MIDSARLRFELRLSSWDETQHTGPSAHLSPQICTSWALTALSGSSARPLSGQGNSEPKKPCFPQFPRIAHLPFSCLTVQSGSAAAWTTDVPKSDSDSHERALFVLSRTIFAVFLLIYRAERGLQTAVIVFQAAGGSCLLRSAQGE